MAKKLDITKEDLYGILGVEETATEKEITKSYRKQALKCHPDKNPDNPKAAEQFHRLTQALEILTDAAAKAAYDKILKAKKAALLRQKHFDSKRKKFKDDLEARERAAGEEKEDTDAAAKKLQAEIERLRKEGNRILQETQEQLRKDLEEKLNKSSDDGVDSDDVESNTAKIKAKWKIKKGEERDEGYTKQELESIFSKYGEVLNIVVSVKKSGAAIIEYSSPYTADLAVKNATGKEDFPLTLSWLSGQPPEDRFSNHGIQETDNRHNTAADTSAPSFSAPSQGNIFSSMGGADKDFESIVLMKMRQAEERKRLIEQMEKEDEENG